MKKEIGRLTTVRENNVGQMELVKREEFAGHEVELYKGANGEVYMTAKQLGEVLEYKHPQRSIDKFIESNEYLQNKEFSVRTELQATDGKIYDTRLLSEKGIVAIVSICRRPLEVKNNVLKLLSNKEKTYDHFRSRDEDEYIHLIQTTFKLFNSEREVMIGDYRCDLLFLEHKLIVECDEYGHRGYDEVLEVKREMYLKSKGYDLIRFNPNSEDFYIGDTLSSILEHLMNTNDFKKQNNEEEELCS